MVAVCICIFTVFYASKIINYAIDLWQTMPIKEERSHPLYISKDIMR